MRKLIAGINMTLDGRFDHTAVDPDEEIHNHYSEQLKNADTALFGRITYQLMTYWQTLLQNPSGNKAMDDFALAIDGIQKIVFSKTLTHTGWHSASIAKQGLRDEVLALRQMPGRDILVSSRSIIVGLLNLNLIDELQLCIHPVAAGTGQMLFEDLNIRSKFALVNLKTFSGGAVLLCYQPLKPV
ncbi:MAG: dihydrofolate reductase family protein [Ignavibacteriales bacterium]|nr:MAG: dihydrofolate reductase family protein [Ignavibacteriales bacterium]